MSEPLIFLKLILNKTSTVVRLYIANVLNRVLARWPSGSPVDGHCSGENK